jgi:hypothetical protein
LFVKWLSKSSIHLQPKCNLHNIIEILMIEEHT